jgi:hypothetical protein
MEEACIVKFAIKIVVINVQLGLKMDVVTAGMIGNYWVLWVNQINSQHKLRKQLNV